MNKDDIETIIEGFAQGIPDRLTGNQENAILVERMGDLVRKERAATVELLRDWLAIRIPQAQRTPEDGGREGRMWVALGAARKYGLSELRSDIENLIADVLAGKTLLPYYADMIAKYLHGIP